LCFPKSLFLTEPFEIEKAYSETIFSNQRTNIKVKYNHRRIFCSKTDFKNVDDVLQWIDFSPHFSRKKTKGFLRKQDGLRYEKVAKYYFQRRVCKNDQKTFCLFSP